jgi:ABC-2 type transport system ATP-binding protein
MIVVDKLCRRFGAHVALDGVSFVVEKGEIAGLLGPNGAGKTTALRILAGALAATDGDAVLAGHSVRRQPLAVKRVVGYLPEGVPLYPEMRVEEYLRYRASLRGLPARRRAVAVAVDRAVDRCGLGDRRRQIIATLSRGLRQRVGLADAIVAEPPILILDEPTVGLDPNQIVEMRALVRELGRDRAVLLSTHILPDVEAVAARVVILHQGRVVAADSAQALRARFARGARVKVAVRAADAAAAAGALGALVASRVLERVEHEPPDGEGGAVFVATAPAADAAAAREAVAAALGGAGVALRELRAEAPPLEEVFARITATDPAAATASGEPVA